MMLESIIKSMRPVVASSTDPVGLGSARLIFSGKMKGLIDRKTIRLSKKIDLDRFLPAGGMQPLEA